MLYPGGKAWSMLTAVTYPQAKVPDSAVWNSLLNTNDTTDKDDSMFPRIQYDCAPTMKVQMRTVTSVTGMCNTYSFENTTTLL